MIVVFLGTFKGSFWLSEKLWNIEKLFIYIGQGFVDTDRTGGTVIFGNQ